MTVYRFIAARKTEHSVKTMCRRLGVSRSGYHAWQRRPPSPRSREDAALIERIAQIHERSLKTLDASERREVAGYLAKYTTKSTEQVGGLLHRVTEHELAALPVREHVRSYLREAFRLAADGAFAECRFAACAHALGYRGHCLTKSRRYPTTFKALREARERHVRAAPARAMRRNARSLARPSACRACATRGWAISQPPTRSWPPRPPRELVNSARRRAGRVSSRAEC